MSTIKTCKNCGKPFKAKNDHYQYCLKCRRHIMKIYYQKHKDHLNSYSKHYYWSHRKQKETVEV